MVAPSTNNNIEREEKDPKGESGNSNSNTNTSSSLPARKASMITRGRDTPPMGRSQSQTHPKQPPVVPPRSTADSPVSSITASSSNIKAAPPPNNKSNNHNNECDYDKAPTLLYKKIEKKAWDDVVQMFEQEDSEDESDDDDDDDDSNVQFEATTTNNPQQQQNNKKRSAKQEASVWVVRKERDGRLRWRLLPLHAALIFNAPVAVVEALVKAFPSAIAMKDDQGYLGLHLACRNAPTNFEVLEELLTAHPAAVYVKDRKGRTPVQGGLAATGNEKNKALSCMSLYCQIAVAGEKQRWRTEHETQTSQKLQLLKEQHRAEIQALRAQHLQEMESLEEQHAVTSGAMAAQLKATRIQHEQTKTELQHLRGQKSFNIQLESSVNSNNSSTNNTSDHSQLAQTNRQLHALIDVLLDQHCSLQESLSTLQKDQEKWDQDRNALMRQYCTVNEQAAATSLAHASIWQEELSMTEIQVKNALKNISLVSESATVNSRSRQGSMADKEEKEMGKDETAENRHDPTTTASSLVKESDSAPPSHRNHSNMHAFSIDTSSSSSSSSSFSASVDQDNPNDQVADHEPKNSATNDKDDEEGEDDDDNDDEKHHRLTQSSYRNPAAVILSPHGAEVLPKF